MKKLILFLFICVSFSCIGQTGQFTHRKGFLKGDQIGEFKFEIKNGKVFISEKFNDFYHSFSEEILMQSKSQNTLDVYTQFCKYKCYFTFGEIIFYKVEVFPQEGRNFYYE